MTLSSVNGVKNTDPIAQTRNPKPFRLSSKMVKISAVGCAAILGFAGVMIGLSVPATLLIGSVSIWPIALGVGGMILGGSLAAIIYAVAKRNVSGVSTEQAEIQKNSEEKPIEEKTIEEKTVEEPIKEVADKEETIQEEPIKDKPVDEKNDAEVNDTRIEVPKPKIELQKLAELLKESFEIYVKEGSLESVSPELQEDILSNYADFIESEYANIQVGFDYLHLAKATTDAEIKFKKSFNRLCNVREPANESCSFLMSSLLSSEKSTVFEEAVIFFSIREAIQNADQEGSQEIFRRLAEKILPVNEREPFVNSLKEEDYSSILKWLPNVTALFVSSKVDNNLIGSVWNQIGLETHRWWFQDIVKPKIQEIASGLNEKSLFEQMKIIEAEIAAIAPLDDKVSALWGKISDSRLVSWKSKEPLLDELCKKFVENELGFDIPAIYQTIHLEKGKIVIGNWASALIHRDVWSPAAPGYDIVLKKLMVQWYQVREEGGLKEINPKIPFLIVLYCYYQDKKQNISLNEIEIKLLKTIEETANNWNKSDELADFVNLLLLNQTGKPLDDFQLNQAKKYANKLRVAAKGKKLIKSTTTRLNETLSILTKISNGDLPLIADEISLINDVNNLLKMIQS